MSYNQYIILYILNRIKGERSIQSIYHLFRGKRSSQTIQDSLLYGLTELFDTLPRIQMKTIQLFVEELHHNGLLQCVQSDHYILTNKGYEYLKTLSETYKLPQALNGYHYGRMARSFWLKLSLIIQTLSNLLDDNNTFIPVTTDVAIHSSVKQILKGKDKHVLAERIFNELNRIMRSTPEQLNEMFVLRLSGNQRVGLTIDQLSQRYKLESIECQLLNEAMLHHIINEVNEYPDGFPTLRLLFGEKNDFSSLTASTATTYRMLKKGNTIQEIAEQRRLKLSTIEDHLVELTFQIESFNIEHYVPKSLYTKIKQVINELNTKRLRLIKDQLDDEITYLQIRLVLAKEKTRGSDHGS